ncbi:hypothetical protein AK812_SmicGene1235 [Symbiodinium microadriaticum]|uniref:Cyclic nucleotide-binding domain-containing protein n=1 Tax=Symbiodinium microadriaticum TaxID=2951 RepID=A0A1Q9F4J1_SYMMI|nr:hypothetical protein AK812_SmicGene1235 [Symbiodinium microadriaticum]
MDLSLSATGSTNVDSPAVLVRQFTPSTNNIAPDNGWERFFAIWVILLAMGVFSSFVGSISSTVNSLRSARVEHIKRHAKLLQFFIERNLSLELYGKVQSALRKGEVEVRLQETEVSLLQRLPHRFKLRMHEEMFMSLLTSLPFWPRWSYGEDYAFFQSLCHQAVAEVAAAPGEDIFLPGTSCNHAHIIESGALGYMPARMASSMASSNSMARNSAESVTKHQHISLVALWADWHHRGKLSALWGMCYFVSIDCDAFGHCAHKYNGPLFRFLHIFGVLLIGQLEAMHDEGLAVTDLGVSNERQKELSTRAQGFVSLVENSHLSRRRNVSPTNAKHFLKSASFLSSNISENQSDLSLKEHFSDEASAAAPAAGPVMVENANSFRI